MLVEKTLLCILNENVPHNTTPSQHFVFHTYVVSFTMSSFHLAPQFVENSHIPNMPATTLIAFIEDVNAFAFYCIWGGRAAPLYDVKQIQLKQTMNKNAVVIQFFYVVWLCMFDMIKKGIYVMIKYPVCAINSCFNTQDYRTWVFVPYM